MADMAVRLLHVRLVPHIQTNAPQHLARPIRMCSLFVGDTVLLTWGLVRIVVLSANVAREFSLGHQVYFTCTTRQRGLSRRAHC
jgi:hypothetical protein